MMSPLPDKVKKVQAPKSKAKSPVLWAGPEDGGDSGGVTFSMLCRFMSCRERARLYFIEGLKAAEGFNHRLEYGNMWHLCEEAFAAATPSRRWEIDLQEYCRELAGRYRFDQEKIDHWYNVCKTQFPVYQEYWRRNPEVVARTAIFQEQVFKIRYKLPSSRTVYLRGKWDGVDLIGKGKDAGVYLFETKTKGDVDSLKMGRQLTYDLQTMLYLVALQPEVESRNWAFDKNRQIRGVRYNVIRRPLSGGKHTIKRHQPSKSQPYGESKEDFYKRLGGLIAEEPSHYFMRWTVDVTPSDIERFRRRTLDPILQSLCGWWDWVSQCHRTGDDSFTAGNGCHWQHPFGVVNPIDEGFATDLDEYVMNGSETGLARVDSLFPELK